MVRETIDNGARVIFLLFFWILCILVFYFRLYQEHTLVHNIISDSFWIKGLFYFIFSLSVIIINNTNDKLTFIIYVFTGRYFHYTWREFGSINLTNNRVVCRWKAHIGSTRLIQVVWKCSLYMYTYNTHSHSQLQSSDLVQYGMWKVVAWHTINDLLFFFFFVTFTFCLYNIHLCYEYYLLFSTSTQIILYSPSLLYHHRHVPNQVYSIITIRLIIL